MVDSVFATFLPTIHPTKARIQTLRQLLLSLACGSDYLCLARRLSPNTNSVVALPQGFVVVVFLS
jgi:hypothetical protein